MPCDVKLQIRSFLNGQLVTGSTTIGLIAEDQQFTMDDVVNYFLLLPKLKRENLATRLRAAKSQTLTNEDIKKHNFISNTSIEELIGKFSRFSDKYKDIKTNPGDNYTLIYANDITLGGKKYSGRLIDSNGNEMFIMGDMYAVGHFLDYLDAKGKIDEAFKNDALIEEFSQYGEKLSELTTKYNMKPLALLLNYMQEKKKFSITEHRFLDKLLADIQGNIENYDDKSELYKAFKTYSSFEKSGNTSLRRITSNKLFLVLNEFFPDRVNNKEGFNALSDDELKSLVEQIFAQDDTLFTYKVTAIEAGKTKEIEKPGKTKSANLDAVKKLWDIIKSTNPDLKGSLAKALEDNAAQTLALFEKFFENNQFLDEDGNSYPATIRLGDTKAGKKRIEIYYTTKDTTVTKSEGKTIVISRPWQSLGQAYNFAYDTEYMWSPVKKQSDSNPDGDPDLDKDGMYHGVYIYEYFDPKTNATNFAVSRHIISPNSTAHIFRTLEGAKAQIDKWNNTLTIIGNSLYILKQLRGVPRESILNALDIQSGLIITTLDVKLPSTSLPVYLLNIFKGTVPEFHKAFNGISNIEALKTPELAAVFIMQFNLLLKTAEAENLKNKNYKEFDTLLEEYKTQGEDLVKQILGLGTKSFRVEDYKPSGAYHFGVLSLLENNGNSIDITGKFGDVNADAPTMATMENAANYFNSQYGLNISVFSKDEFDAFNSQNNLNLTPDTRAFVYNGNIYLNGSLADVSDMFHEMSHIFLGLVKAHSRDAYLDVVSKFRADLPTEFSRKLNFIKKKYANFSNEDIIEETMVHMMAEKMFKKKSLATEFKGSDFENDFNFILKTVLDKYPAMLLNTDANSLNFQGLMSELRNTANIEKMNRNMKISQLIRSYIDLKLIKEWGC